MPFLRWYHAGYFHKCGRSATPAAYVFQAANIPHCSCKLSAKKRKKKKENYSREANKAYREVALGCFNVESNMVQKSNSSCRPGINSGSLYGLWAFVTFCLIPPLFASTPSASFHPFSQLPPLQPATLTWPSIPV